MSEQAPSPKRSRIRLIASVFAIVMLICAAVLAFAWIFRASIVEMAISRYCDQRSLQCEADVAKVGLNQAQISSVQISSDGREVLTTGAIDADYSWPKLFALKLDKVAILSPELRIGFDGTQIDFLGLERLQSEDSSASAAAPPITIKDGRISVETPAGVLTAFVDVEGELPQNGHASVRVDAADLRAGNDHLSLKKGGAEVDIQNGLPSGTAVFEIESARLGDLDLQLADFNASLTGSGGASQISWKGTADSVVIAERSATRVVTNGEATLADMPDGGMNAAFSSLQSITAELSAGSSNLGGVATGPIQISADVSQAGAFISGPFGFDANSVSTLTGIAERASASGELKLHADNPSDFSFKGSGIAEGVGINAPRRAEWLTSIRVPEPFAAHGIKLRSTFDRALSDFDTGADIRVSRQGPNWRLEVERPTALRSASGMTVSVEPLDQPNWLVLSNDGMQLSGEVVVSGGGGPDIDAVLSTAAMSDAALSVETERLDIAPWQVDGRSLGVSLAPFNMTSDEKGLRVDTRGRLTTAGAFPGADVKATSLTGGFEATRGPEGWRVQTTRGACVDLVSEGLRSGALKLKPIALNICPEDGRFVREENGNPTGRVLLGDLALPFETVGSAGTLGLRDSTVNWSLGDGLVTVIEGRELALPLELLSGSVSIDGDNPRLTITAGDGPLRIDASLSESAFGGDLIPANVTAAGFQFSGVAVETGLDGTLRSDDVRIEDFREDPLYEPLRADLTATITDGVFRMSGPLRLRKSGWTIAQSSLELELGRLNGTAQLVGQTLNFTRSGLQPHNLSDRLRSALPNARGSMVGNADFTITEGDLSGTGSIKVEGLGFDTFRLGSIDGVNGEMRFSDIIALTTFPNQTLTIESIDPGVRLENGELSFQLIGGEIMQLQGAHWPFAGGALLIAPTRWEFGGKTELITITADKIKLEELIDALSLEKEIRADGTITGTFPIEIIGPNAFIRDATLKADDAGGLLAYLGNGLDAAKGQSEASDYALEALKDFRFKVLEVGANGNISGWIVLSVALEGQSPDVLDGAPFRFNMTFDSKLAQLIRSIQSGSSATSGTAFVKEILSETAEEPEGSEE